MKKNFLIRLSLALSFGLSLFIMGCPQVQRTNTDDNNKPNNPDTPVVQSLISKVVVESGNGTREIPVNGDEINTKGKVKMQVILKEGVEAENTKIEAKLAGVNVDFGAFVDSGYGGARSICEDVQGITNDAKEMVITVTSGKDTDTFRLKLKEFDESGLQKIQLMSLYIGEEKEDNNIASKLSDGNLSFRIYDPNSKTIKFKAVTNQDLTKAVMVVNGEQTVLQLTQEDKTAVEATVLFEDNSVKHISFIFSAEGCQNTVTNSLSLTYTNQLNTTISVDTSGRGGGRVLTDDEVMSGSVAFNKCTTTKPRITVKLLKGHGVLTRVTADEAQVEINSETNQGREFYVAVYELASPLQKLGDKKTVKLHIEGTNVDGSKVKDVTDVEISFTLIEPIEAKIELQADGKGYTALQDGHRVYSPNVKLKVISTNDDLKDVVLKDYKDADGSVPEFEITGKEAVVNLNLKDTEMNATTFKIVLSADNKSDTIMTGSVRYTAKNDPLGFVRPSFEYGSVEKTPDAEGAFVMVSDEAKLYILLARNVKEVTSMKVNDVEVMGKSQADPDKIVLEAKFQTTEGQGGRNTNAIFVFGGDKMVQGRVYTLNISMAGKDDEGRVLAENSFPVPLKIKMPVFDPKSTDWIAPDSNSPEAMQFITLSEIYHEKDTAHSYYNSYSIQSYGFAVRPKNPKAKVKGIWYRHDGNNIERAKILADAQEEKGSYAKHFLKFTEQQTILGKCKWCSALDFETEEFKNSSISVYLWVVAEDGTTNKGVNCDDTIHTPWEQHFRKVGIACSYTKLGNEVGWDNGWNATMQVTDKAEIDYSKVQNDKLYFRANTFQWMADTTEYHLFNDAPESPISEFVNIVNKYRNDNRFTVDVSSLKDAVVGTPQAEMEISVPVWMKGLVEGKTFMENVFTRKFKIVKVK